MVIFTKSSAMFIDVTWQRTIH